VNSIYKYLANPNNAKHKITATGRLQKERIYK